jgi:arsenate reductase-like glutaredoxin family protein
MAEKVILYTTPNCSTCDRARADLFAEFDEHRRAHRHP